MKETLKQLLSEAGFTGIFAPKTLRVGSQKLPCFICSETRSKKHDLCLTLTIDDDDGAVWNCHHCQAKGNIPGTGGFRSRNWQTKKYSKPAQYQTNKESAQLLENFFSKRGISQKTIDAFGVKVVNFKGFPVIAFPYVKNGIVVNHKYRGINEKRMMNDQDTEPTLFNHDRMGEAPDGELLIAEGEIDVMTWYEMGFTYAVSLRDGAPASVSPDTNQNKRLTPLVESAPNPSEVIIATDADQAGDALAEMIVRRYSPEICSRLIFKDRDNASINDANDALVNHNYDPEDFIKAFDLRIHCPIAGIYFIDDHPNEVFDIYKGRIYQGNQTGHKLLDEHYKIMPGQLHVITGFPGHGKSNFLDELVICLHKKHGWNFCLFSAEHSIPRHIIRLTEKIIQKPFEEGHYNRMTIDEVESGMTQLNEFIYFCQHATSNPSIDWIIEKFKIAVRRYGINGFTIDPYNRIARKSNLSEREHIADLLNKLKRFAMDHKVVVWIVAHPTKMSDDKSRKQIPTLRDISGGADWNNMVDMGISIDRNFDTGDVKIYIRKIKEQPAYGKVGIVEFDYIDSQRRYVEKIA